MRQFDLKSLKSELCWPRPDILRVILVNILGRFCYFYKSVFIWFFLAGCLGCGQREAFISGQTMGTTYHITVVTGYLTNIASLKDKIEQRLAEINKSMSTFLPDSEISRFNRIKSTTRYFHPTADFLFVISKAHKIYKLTHGAWDGTIFPLIRLWGFEEKKYPDQPPPESRIQELLAETGFEHIQIIDGAYLKKEKPDIILDLASIAKGYGVDQISDLLQKAGFNNFLVEIGGEVYAAGCKSNGKQWRVGINRPAADALPDETAKVLNIEDKALATSGDYRNFFIIDQKYYSHIIDPQTGYPVDNHVVSVSILAGNCTMADGLATAVMVLGHKKGLELINQIKGVEGLIIMREPDETFKEYQSPGFPVIEAQKE